MLLVLCYEGVRQVSQQGEPSQIVSVKAQARHPCFWHSLPPFLSFPFIFFLMDPGTIFAVVEASRKTLGVSSR